MSSAFIGMALAAYNRSCGKTFAVDTSHRCTPDCSFWEWKGGAPSLTFVCRGSRSPPHAPKLPLTSPQPLARSTTAVSSAEKASRPLAARARRAG